MKPIVQLYVTEGCGLCAEAKAMLTTLQAKTSFELREILLTPDHPRYGDFAASVPVIVINEKHELVAPVDPKEVARILTRGTHRDPVYVVGTILKWLGLFAGVAGIVLRLVGEAHLGYGVFAGALLAYGIGRFLIRGRRGELAPPNLDIATTDKTT